MAAISYSVRPQLPRHFVALGKRRRLIEALAALCFERGYRSVTVALLCSRARLARATYYEHFSSTEEVFLAALDSGFGEASQRAADACAASPSACFEERLRAGLGALLDLVGRRPEMAWVCLVEAPGLSPGADRYEAGIGGFATALGAIAPPSSGRVGPATSECVVGGIASVLRTRLRHGEADDLSALLPELSAFALSVLRNTGVDR